MSSDSSAAMPDCTEATARNVCCSAYLCPGGGPVIYLLCETAILLDLIPLGRSTEHVRLLHHDKYPEGGHDQQPE